MKAGDVKGAAFFGGVVGLLSWVVQYAPREAGIAPWWPWGVAVGAAVVLGAGIALLHRRPLVRLGCFGAGVFGLGLWLWSDRVPAATPGREYWPLILAFGGLVLAGAIGFGLHRQSGTSGTVGFWAWRTKRNKGVASAWQIWRTSSVTALRRKATQLRPGLRELNWWQRRQVSPRELGTPLARVGLFRVWSSVEDVTLRVGGPRTGKTGELACRILDAPGAVIATSTRTDLIKLTGPCRARRGPLYVFNPAGVGEIASTITFDPLAGCESPKVAATRAADLVSGVAAPGRDGGDRDFWETLARRALAALMHAAALGRLSMRDVHAWAANPDEAKNTVTRLLRRSPEPAMQHDADQFLSTNDRTRSSVTSTIMPALGWLSDPIAAKTAQDSSFDVARLLADRGTVYMLGAEDAQTAPLVTALTGHIAREARRIASLQPSGRLDPPLTLALDEAALICPVPLDEWTADMGGRGVTIHIAAQSRAQLRQRWGDTGAASIINNAATLLIFGGTRDTEDLNAWATLTGERDEQVPTYDEHRNIRGHSIRRVPVLTAAQIAQLKERRVVIIRRGMPAAVGKVRMAWQRADVKFARRWNQLADRRERIANAWNKGVDWSVRKLAAADVWLTARQNDRARERRSNSDRRDGGQR